MTALTRRTFLAMPVFAAAAERPHSRSTVYSNKGIVSTSHVLASQAGAQALARGGSALDAALAANLALSAVEPMMCGPGGDFFLIYFEAATGKLHGLNASGPAPRGLSIQALTRLGMKSMPRSGIHSVTVPGAVDGWHRAHARFGRLEWADLFPAAIDLAEAHPVHEIIADHWPDERAAEDPDSAKLFLPAPKTGQVFKNPALARFFKTLAAGGRDAFYKGEIAAAILATSRKRGGTLAAEDLASFESEWVEPISTTYRNARVYELPPNGQGLAALLMLNIMGQFPPARQGALSAEEWHTRIEAMKLAYADVAATVTDPRHFRVPVAKMLSPEHARSRAGLIQPGKANCAVNAAELIASPDTTYLAAVDRGGNVASWIQSISALWGSGVPVEDFGFPLQNRGASFTLEPGHPNVLAPGKRTFHTIIPGFIEYDGWRAAFGIMGGPNQPLAHAQFVSNMVDFGMDFQAALDAPRFTKAAAAGCDVRVENRLPAATLEGLSRRGHLLDIRAAYSTTMGRGAAAAAHSSSGLKAAACDPRSDGAAVPEL
jgi:gamma-glutamyltranspeptidase/glutathione hydrolase